MRKLLIIGMIAMINVFADERLGFDFSEFDGIDDQILLLSRDKDVLAVTRREVDRLVASWKQRDLRKKSLILLKKANFNTLESGKIVVVEWGGGGLGYRALYLSKRIFYIRELGDQLKIDEILVKDSLKLKEDIHAIIEILKKDSDYIGNISGFSFDTQTYFLTFLNEKEIKKSIIISGSSVIKIKKRICQRMRGILYLSGI
ncbi:MAG: hypothetical protein L6W00_09085 [Lentisphaeria bacterium]|nr:MAG: hypothetical protein L6W00_09085 [Lentisphaeria bacterium]